MNTLNSREEAGREALPLPTAVQAALAALALFTFLLVIQVAGLTSEPAERSTIIVATPTAALIPTLRPLPTLMPTAIPVYQPPAAAVSDHSVNVCIGWCPGANAR